MKVKTVAFNSYTKQVFFTLLLLLLTSLSTVAGTPSAKNSDFQDKLSELATCENQSVKNASTDYLGTLSADYLKDSKEKSENRLESSSLSALHLSMKKLILSLKPSVDAERKPKEAQAEVNRVRGVYLRIYKSWSILHRNYDAYFSKKPVFASIGKCLEAIEDSMQKVNDYYGLSRDSAAGADTSAR